MLKSDAWLCLALTTSLLACGRGSGRVSRDAGAVGGQGGSSFTAGAGGSAPPTAGAGGGGSVAAAPIAVTDLCPIFTSDLCIYLMQCGGERYKDLDQCKRELDCYGMTQLLDSAANHRVTYDPSKVGACHQTFLASPCTFGSFIFTPDIYEVLSFCPGTLTPNQGDGDPCVSDGECKANLYCYKGADWQCPGVCQAKAQNGDSCAGSAQCASGLTCGTGQVCVPAQKAGDTCDSYCNYSFACLGSDPCPGNIWCDQSSHTCQPGRLEGEACGTLLNGLADHTPICAINLWCNAVGTGTGTCQRASSQGGPCSGTELSCAKGLHCDGYVSDGAGAKLGTCVGPAPAGSNCSSTSDCQTGMTCTGGVCGALAPAGGFCYGDSDCAAGLVCNSQTCAPARYPGASCNTTDQPCAYSRCMNGTCQDLLKVGQACAGPDDCATSECVNGFCYDSSVCNAP